MPILENDTILPNESQEVNTSPKPKLSASIDAINSPYGTPTETIQLKARQVASDAAQEAIASQSEILAGINALSGDDIFTKIANWNLIIPHQMSLNYWLLINQWGEINANRYKIECEDDELLDIIRKLLKNACLFGRSAFISKEKYGVLNLVKANKWTGKIESALLQPLPMAAQDVITGGQEISFIPNETFENISEDSAAVLQWRDITIGDYVLLMPYLTMEIYKKRVIDTNANNDYNCPVASVGNLGNFQSELKFNNNVFNGVKVRILDSQGGDINKWDYEKNKPVSFLQELHTDMRFHQEYYYGIFGIEIGGAKGQSLSSDSYLALSRVKALKEERYRRIRIWLKKIEELTKTPIILIEEDVDLTPFAANADKANPETDTEDAQGFKNKHV